MKNIFDDNINEKIKAMARSLSMLKWCKQWHSCRHDNANKIVKQAAWKKLKWKFKFFDQSSHGNKQYQAISVWALDVQQSLKPSQWRISKKMADGYFNWVQLHEQKPGMMECAE